MYPKNSVVLSKPWVILIDSRDPRGNRHGLVFIVAAGVLAVLSGRSRVSSIHRFIRNRLVWLRAITGQGQAQAISRAHFAAALSPLGLGRTQRAD